MLGALEAKVHALEEQLDGEVRYEKNKFQLKNYYLFNINREKQKVSRTVRTLEKRLRDAAGLADESRKQADAYKEQVQRKIFLFIFNFIIEKFFFYKNKKVEKANMRVRNMKRREEELEEEVAQMKQRLRKALREKDEIEENPTYQRTR